MFIIVELGSSYLRVTDLTLFFHVWSSFIIGWALSTLPIPLFFLYFFKILLYAVGKV